MKILIVYELVPEATRFYSVDVTDDEWKWMSLTHGKLINGEMDKAAFEACSKLLEWLGGRATIEDSQSAPIACRGTFAYVLWTGFIL